MLTTLLPGLRNLRVAATTGALLVGSLYVLLGDKLLSHVSARQSAQNILDLSPAVPGVLVALLCVLIGSLYVTALEGFVDWLHRRMLFSEPGSSAGRLKKRAYTSVSPLSAAAKARLLVEAEWFYVDRTAELTDEQRLSAPSQDSFVHQVAYDVLWLEGKLAGTHLEAPYDQFRSEGEFRLATSLLIPLTTVAALYAIHSRWWLVLVVMLPTLAVALKLADYGLYYFRKAHSFLAHHIADGSLLTPAMEGLARQDRTGRPPTPTGNLTAAS